MRILFACNSIPTHFTALLPVVRAAQRAGHRVAVATAPDLRAVVEAQGLELLPAGGDWLTPLTSRLAKRLPGAPLWLAHRFEPFFNARMAGRPAVDAGCDLVIAALAWKPDLIVRECSEFGSALAAETLGVPSICVGTGCFAPEAYPPATLARTLAASRAAMGLPRDPEGVRAYPTYVSLMPRRFDPLVERIPNVRFHRSDDLVGEVDVLPDWLAAIPRDRPLVYGCLGNVSLAYGNMGQHARRMMRAMVAALSELDCEVVISTNGWADPEDLGTPPPHVRVMTRVPQKLVLSLATLFVTHAGYDSVRESVAASVPMVTIPLIGDARYTARRAAEAGVAVNLTGRDVHAGGIRRACETVLAEPDYRRAVASLRDELLALPDLDRLIAGVTAFAH